MLTRLAARITVACLSFRAGQGDGDDDRGDVPGWVLVTAMTVALVLAVWAIANEQITRIIRDALNQAKFGSGS